MEKGSATGKYYILGYSIGDGIYTLSDDGELKKEVLVRDGKERLLRFSLVSQQIKWLQKELLTIAEATVEERKLEPTKRLIKDKFNAKISWLYELCGMPEEQQDFLDEPED